MPSAPPAQQSRAGVYRGWAVARSASRASSSSVWDAALLSPAELRARLAMLQIIAERRKHGLRPSLGARRAEAAHAGRDSVGYGFSSWAAPYTLVLSFASVFFTLAALIDGFDGAPCHTRDGLYTEMAANCTRLPTATPLRPHDSAAAFFGIKVAECGDSVAGCADPSEIRLVLYLLLALDVVCCATIIWAVLWRPHNATRAHHDKMELVLLSVPILTLLGSKFLCHYGAARALTALLREDAAILADGPFDPVAVAAYLLYSAGRRSTVAGFALVQLLTQLCAKHTVSTECLRRRRNNVLYAIVLLPVLSFPAAIFFRFAEPQTFPTCAQAYYFMFVTLSSIGYGDITPSTVHGQVAVAVISMLGCPIFLIIMVNFGEVFMDIMDTAGRCISAGITVCRRQRDDAVQPISVSANDAVAGNNATSNGSLKDVTRNGASDDADHIQERENHETDCGGTGAVSDVGSTTARQSSSRHDAWPIWARPAAALLLTLYFLCVHMPLTAIRHQTTKTYWDAFYFSLVRGLPLSPSLSLLPPPFSLSVARAISLHMGPWPPGDDVDIGVRYSLSKRGSNRVCQHGRPLAPPYCYLARVELDYLPRRRDSWSTVQHGSGGVARMAGEEDPQPC